MAFLDNTLAVGFGRPVAIEHTWSYAVLFVDVQLDAHFADRIQCRPIRAAILDMPFPFEVLVVRRPIRAQI